MGNLAYDNVTVVVIFFEGALENMKKRLQEMKQATT